eukprot:jgi/Orpsp1_1/1186561/evm.model.d7180000051482.1
MFYPTNNIIFKNLFGIPQNKDLMIDFLNKILDLKENPIIDLVYINTEMVSVKEEKSLINKMNENENEDKKIQSESNEINDKNKVNDHLFGRNGRMDL